MVENSEPNLQIRYDVIDQGTNLSNHKPICFSINFAIKCMHNNDQKNVVTILDWHKATEEHKQNYNALLNYYLTNIPLNDEVLSCSNMLCQTQDESVFKLFDDISSIMNKCAWLSIPRRVIGRQHIAGWNESVNEYREKAMFWHDIWKSCGRPVSGQVADLRRFTRTKYHWAVKQAKKGSDNTIKDKTALALMRCNFDSFWTTLKTMNSSKTAQVHIVDKVEGDQNIADLFRDIYSNLYNCIEDNNIYDIQLEIQNEVRDKCAVGLCRSPNCHNISTCMVERAIEKLNPHKKDVIYNLDTNNFIFGKGQLQGILAKLFQYMLTHGICNMKFFKSIINPIPKNKKKSKNDSTNYRAISLNTIFSKLFDHIVIEMIGDTLKTSEMQFAYKNKYSTTLCSFLVVETIQYYNNNGTNVFALLMDATKAFDRVKYSKLFSILKSRKVCPLIMRMLLILYLTNTAVVKWNDKLSDSLKVSNGVKQGGVASTHLFSIYIDPLIDSIRSSKIGCHVGELISNVFAYADDLIILCPTVSGLKKIIIMCEDYGGCFELLFNPGKCYLLIFKCKDLSVNENILIYICGKRVKVVTKEVHLGNVLSTVGAKIDMENAINDMKGRTVAIVNNFNNISFKSKTVLFNSQCTALYGCQLWDLGDENVDRLCTTWRKCVRYLLGLHPRTKSYVLPYLMETNNIIDLIMERQVLFYIDLNNHPCDIIRKYFLNSMTSYSSYCVKNVNTFINKFNISLYEVLTSSKRKIKSLIQRSYPVMDWRAAMIEELLHARDGVTNLDLTKEEISLILQHIACDL